LLNVYQVLYVKAGDNNFKQRRTEEAAMDSSFEKLYSELRATKEELLERLESGRCSALIQPLIYDELADINRAIEKLETGEYGKCEISGELIPENLLSVIPTMVAMSDYDKLGAFCRKPMESVFEPSADTASFLMMIMRG
jgi:RNA polymerase-binding transcription factor DksA